MSLHGKSFLVTGAARRVGRALAMAIARRGGKVYLHHSSSAELAEQARVEIQSSGGSAVVVQADFSEPGQAEELVPKISEDGPLLGLINSAAIFEPLDLMTTRRADWDRHLAINLTAPFLLSQAFAAALPADGEGRIVNMLDWRALRPAGDHLPYTISKAGLVALTKSLAVSLAPRVTVNGLALGAVLPPSDGSDTKNIIAQVPAGRWARLEEVEEALIFLLEGPGYITGEIIHIDGGRHLV
jgi:NAD(P)-dependent dehydrogenase (short-subunit alcohol dehydrogenase family)